MKGGKHYHPVNREKGHLSHGSQPFKFRLITANEAHAPHNAFVDVTPAWCYHSI